ncbi:MAG: ATP-binding protein [Gammaproteobacteria bacterium]|nr:ATP-binding protein [Gammaproteobacteria bacterium]
MNVRDALESMAGLLRRTLGAEVALEVEVSDPDLHVRVDPVEFESALLNLALNARDAMPDGGSLRLTADRAGVDRVRISVADTGTGIEESALAHVREPFFSTKPTGSGSGLGLSMVDGFVRHSGGSLGIDSTPGHGTRVDLVLPAAAGSGVSAPAREEAEVLPEAGDGAVVLVVEDEPSVREMVIGALGVLGHRVVAVADGHEALARLAEPEHFDLILSDVVLPGEVSGVDVVRRARRERPGLPCILMTGYARSHLADGDPEIRDLPLLHKPFRLAELRRVLEAALEHREAGA